MRLVNESLRDLRYCEFIDIEPTDPDPRIPGCVCGRDNEGRTWVLETENGRITDDVKLHALHCDLEQVEDVNMRSILTRYANTVASKMFDDNLARARADLPNTHAPWFAR